MPNGACTWLECSKFWKNGKKEDYSKINILKITNMFIINQ